MKVEKRSKPKWGEMNAVQRAGMITMALIQFSLLAAALWDLRTRPADEVRGDKRLWVGVSFINFIGPISYFLIGRKR